MSDTNISKIKIEMGPIKVEYEGTQSFLKKELPELLSAVSKLYGESAKRSPSSSGHDKFSDGRSPGRFGTTGSIASRLKVASGPNLILAAAAHLVMDQDK